MSMDSLAFVIRSYYAAASRPTSSCTRQQVVYIGAAGKFGAFVILGPQRVELGLHELAAERQSRYPDRQEN